MATLAKTIQTKNGTIAITRTRETQDKIWYADGANLRTGRENVDITEIVVRNKDGKQLTKSLHVPQELTPQFYKNYQELVSKGAYARLGDAYIGQESFQKVMAALAELDAELGQSDEFAAITKAEAAAEAAETAAYIPEPKHGENGYCRKCHSYCYGDCEA